MRAINYSEPKQQTEKAVENATIPIPIGRQPISISDIFCTSSLNGDNNEILFALGGQFADSRTKRIFKSTDGGDVWIELKAKTKLVRGIYDLAVSPTFVKDRTLFAVSYYNKKIYGVLKSINDGSSWTQIDVGKVKVGSVSNIVISPDYAQDRTIFLITENNILKSTNEGKNWKNMNPGLKGRALYFVSISPNYRFDKKLLLVTKIKGNRTEIYQSKKGGESWQKFSGPRESYVNEIIFSPTYAKDKAIFFGSLEGKLYKTTDNGRSWTRLSTRASGMRHTGAIAISPTYASDQTILMSGAQDRDRLHSGFFKSDNGGKSFVEVETKGASGIKGARVISFSPDYLDNNTIFVSSAKPDPDWPKNGKDGWPLESGIYKSTDDGKSWRFWNLHEE